MIGSIGTAFYVSDKHGELVYKPTMCFVKSYATIIETCSQQNCNRELGTSVCTTDYYPCSKSMYTVAYNVSDGREVISTIISTDGPGADSVNKAFKCYYDSTKETSVRWSWFNSHKYLILMCVGWSITGFSILVLTGSIIFFYVEQTSDKQSIGKCDLLLSKSTIRLL